MCLVTGPIKILIRGQRYVIIKLPSKKSHTSLTADYGQVCMFGMERYFNYYTLQTLQCGETVRALGFVIAGLIIISY